MQFSHGQEQITISHLNRGAIQSVVGFIVGPKSPNQMIVHYPKEFSEIKENRKVGLITDKYDKILIADEIIKVWNQLCEETERIDLTLFSGFSQYKGIVHYCITHWDDMTRSFDFDGYAKILKEAQD